MNTQAIHRAAPADVFALLDTRPEGLRGEEADALLVTVGPNRVEEDSALRWVHNLVRQFTNLFSLLLDVSAVMCFVAESAQPGQGMAVLGYALLGVSVLNSLFAFLQEYRAERAMAELRKYLPQTVRVRRDGRELSAPSDQLVPGDVLLVAEGDRIPADARLVEGQGLLANNAPLTGESRSVALTAGPARGQFGDSPNILFAGCAIMAGSGTAVVFATGPCTAFGRLAVLSRDIRRPPAPLQRETARMIRVLTVIAVTMGILFFLYGLAAGRPLWVNLVFMLGIIVANVPEGLLPTFTLALSMASLRMARKQVLVKSLDAIEALGAVHTVCTDKTGTLTLNRLALVGVFDGLTGNEMCDTQPLRTALTAALIASEVRETDQGYRGDPLDVAVAERFRSLFGKPGDVITRTSRHFPFDLRKRREAGLYTDGAVTLFAVKGAWESLREMIGTVEDPHTGEDLPVDADRLRSAEATVHRLSARGQRVIAVASYSLPALPDQRISEEALEQGKRLHLLGFLAFEDPIYPEVPAAVARCREASIRVLMVTGDHPETAAAVARRCGIVGPEQPTGECTLLGEDLERLEEGQLLERLRAGVAIFARSTPEHKMKIVTALKRLGHVVGMTGDGVNDAPALKAADVGIAMGRDGTDVAREAADIVLLDNNFASLAEGVEEGRGVYANIQKFTTYVLASNVPEILPYLLYIVFPVPLGLTVVQILCVDLGTDLLPAIGLGQEPPEPETMRRPPRKMHERLLSFRLMATSYLFLGLIEAAYSLFLFFLVLVHGGWTWGQELADSSPLYRSATGITLSTVILMQVGNVLSRRLNHGLGLDWGLLRNRLLLLGIAVEIFFSWAILYWPPVQAVLRTGGVDLAVYGLAWLGIPLILGLDTTRKRVLRTTLKGSFPRAPR